MLIQPFLSETAVVFLNKNSQTQSNKHENSNVKSRPQKEVSGVAKDGTNRGGARAGAGRKSKPLADKILEGNPGKRPIKIVDFSDAPKAERPPNKSPPTAPEFLKFAAKETASNYPTADVIYTQIATWLDGTGVAHLVSPTLIEDFALNRRSFFECEFMNRSAGRLYNGKKSPYVEMAMNYANLMRAAWDRIWGIVKDNSEKIYNSKSAGGEDIMESLLSRKE
jgi:hypothetical protein